MGFFDGLKSMTNAITGGAAKVDLEVLDPTVRGPFTVVVRALVGDADLEINRVYVKVCSEEEVEPRGVYDAEGNELEIEVQTFAAEYEVAGAATLPAGSEHEWAVEIELPEGCQPSYKGPNAEHEWEFFAGLDAFGNDPDSGWIDVEVW
ncbi:MAG: sporulation protein [Magnetococcales bacterium]|nr:sporulation protein [Magnetococcales bacterium]